MKKILFILSILGSMPAFTEISLDTYTLSDCDIRVERAFADNNLEIRVDNNKSQFGTVEIGRDRLIVESITGCNYPITSESIREDNSILIKAKCGGIWKAWDNTVSFRIDNKTKKLIMFSINSKVAKWSLPNGMHSGPIKDSIDVFSCKK